MNPFELVLSIVFLVIAGRLIQQWITLRSTAHARGSDPALEQHRDEIRQLRERVQVLERVITDTHGSRQLDSEIERLRDR